MIAPKPDEFTTGAFIWIFLLTIPLGLFQMFQILCIAYEYIKALFQ